MALFAAPLDDARDARNLLARRLLFAGSIALLLAVGLGFAVADALARRLRRLQASADRIAAGDFDHPVVDSSPDEIGDLSRSFEAMRAQLERLDRVRSQFIANASHELRTPLTSLGGFLELTISPTVAIDSIRCTARAWQVRSSHGVGLGWSSGVSRRSTGWSAASAASDAISGSIGSGAAAHSSGPASPVVAQPLQALHEVLPASSVCGRLLGVESGVLDGHPRAGLGRLDRHRHRRRVGRQRVTALPAPAEDDPASGLHDLAVGAGETTCPGVTVKR